MGLLHDQGDRVPDAAEKPTRLDAARERHGDAVDRFVAYRAVADPAADALVAELNALPPGRGAKLFRQALGEGIGRVHRAPPALKDFFAQVDDVPLWVDWKQLELGGSVFLRAGPLAGLVLSCYSLPIAYSSSTGNKPLAISSELVSRAFRRLSETGRYVVEVCRPGGLRRQAPGFAISVRVRLVHAQIRRLLLRSGSWREDEWGVPINQADMAGTNILFSAVVIDGLRQLGLRFADEEVEALIQLWRYAGLLMGVDPQLCASSQREGLRLEEIVRATSGEPDDDSRRLVEALIRAPETMEPLLAKRLATRLVAFQYAVSRRLIGDQLADSLRFPHSGWRHVLTPMRIGLEFLSLGQRLHPRGRALATDAGLDAWERFIEQGLTGRPASFVVPTSLRGLAGRGGRRARARA